MYRYITIGCQLVLIISFLAAGACSKTSQVKERGPSGAPFDDSVGVVKVEEKDTFSSLAAIHLKDPSKGWMIAAFNGIEKLTPGTYIVIPKGASDLGGLRPNGFQTVPVLLYHGFTKEKPRNKMIVSEAAFNAQMKYLKDNGFHALTMKQFLNFLDFKEPVPPKSVLITLDDGWKSQDDIAIPILKKYGFPATFFIYTDFIGSKAALSWDDIRELIKDGFDIQCHSKTHRDLTELKRKESFKDYIAAIEKELIEPRNLMRVELNQECSCLAYPYGETNHLIVSLLEKNGYHAGFTVIPTSNPFFVGNYMIHRTAIYREHTLEDFKKKLSVFYEKELR